MTELAVAAAQDIDGEDNSGCLCYTIEQLWPRLPQEKQDSTSPRQGNMNECFRRNTSGRKWWYGFNR